MKMSELAAVLEHETLHFLYRWSLTNIAVADIATNQHIKGPPPPDGLEKQREAEYYYKKIHKEV